MEVTAVRVVIGLGANVGDRRGNIDRALAMLAATEGVEVVAVSPIAETAPVGPPQDPYLNGAVLVRTTLSLRELLDAALAIEQSLGRVRGERWGPRTLDLDLLWSDGPPVNEPGLVVPHPELMNRTFALGPLLAVLPDASDDLWQALLALHLR